MDELHDHEFSVLGEAYVLSSQCQPCSIPGANLTICIVGARYLQQLDPVDGEGVSIEIDAERTKRPARRAVTVGLSEVAVRIALAASVGSSPRVSVYVCVFAVANACLAVFLWFMLVGQRQQGLYCHQQEI